MTACYLQDSLPALLDSALLHEHDSVWQSLLANANVGGENVHRGSCLGAILGYHSTLPLEPHLMAGLHNHDELAQEIDAFVASVVKK